MFESTVVCGRIALGIQGEHHARKVSFAETQLWKERFGEGRFELLHKRNGDDVPYPITLTIDDDVPYWYVTASDTAVAGVGKCELRYIVNDVVIKSCTFITDVDASLGEGTAEIPDPYKAWVDEVLEAAEDVKDATIHQPIIGENGNWWVWDFNASAYVDTGVSVSGGGATSWNDLEDKPFGEFTVEQELVASTSITVPPSQVGTTKLWSALISGFAPAVGERYTIEATDAMTGRKLSTTAICEEEAYTFLTNYKIGENTDTVYCYGSITSVSVYVNGTGYTGWRIGIYKEVATIKTLDEKYIPDTIARVEDIPNYDNLVNDVIAALPNAEGVGF